MRRVCLCLMTFKGYRGLQTIVESDFRSLIGLVIVGRDRNIENDFADEIIKLCKSNGLDCIERNQEQPIKYDYTIAISWRWTISISATTLIVLHDSLLPKYRGFAPLINQLINKEPAIGVTALFATEEYDKGNIISQKKKAIEYPLKISNAIEAVSQLYCELVYEIFYSIYYGNLGEGRIQEESEATYSLWRDEQDYRIDWNNDAEYIKRFVDAVGHPYKGAETLMNGKYIKVLDAEVIGDVNIVNRDVGKMIFIKEGYPIVVCKEGLIKITRAFYKDDGNSIFPLTKFRIRFK